MSDQEMFDACLQLATKFLPVADDIARHSLADEFMETAEKFIAEHEEEDEPEEQEDE